MNWHLSSVLVHCGIHPNVSFTVISEAACTWPPLVRVTEPTLQKGKNKIFLLSFSHFKTLPFLNLKKGLFFFFFLKFGYT